jgi:hypothetical protein
MTKETDQSQDARIIALEKGQKDLQVGQEEMLKLLRPISETYRTVSTLGKWMMAILVFMSILIGVLIGFKSLIVGSK